MPVLNFNFFEWISGVRYCFILIVWGPTNIHEGFQRLLQRDFIWLGFQFIIFKIFEWVLEFSSLCMTFTTAFIIIQYIIYFSYLVIFIIAPPTSTRTLPFLQQVSSVPSFIHNCIFESRILPGPWKELKVL